MREQHPYTAKVKRRRVLYFEFGMIIALSFCLWAFNTNYEVIELRPSTVTDPIDEWDTIYSSPIKIEDEMPKPKTEEAPKASSIPTDEFRLVDNTVDIQEPADITKIDITDIIDLIPKRVEIQEVAPDGNEIHDFSGILPQFKGGEAAMFKFIYANFTYPPLAVENGIQGKYNVTFVVEKDGSLSNIEVTDGLGYGLDEEAKRIVSIMPNWEPGENNFRPVRVRMKLPIKAVLK